MQFFTELDITINGKKVNFDDSKLPEVTQLYGILAALRYILSTPEGTSILSHAIGIRRRYDRMVLELKKKEWSLNK